MTSNPESTNVNKKNAERPGFSPRGSVKAVEKNKKEITQNDEKIKSKGTKTYQVKGTHEKSYLNLSQMMILSLGNSSGSSDESIHVKSEMQSTSHFEELNSSLQDSQNLSDTYFDSNIDTQDITNTIETVKKTGQFAKHYSTPSLFQGKYKMASVSEIELHKDIPHGFSKISIVSSKQTAEPFEVTQPKWKFVLSTNTMMKQMQKRGFYSETVSPLLRPEKILAARHKEMEEMRLRYALEIEGEKEEESDIYIEDASEEPEKIIDRSMDKDLLKDWPPIYKVLNPEVALAEFDLPVVYKEPSLISKGRMPKYAPHLENVPTPTVSRNFLQPEENWVVYESEPNVAFPVKAFKPRCYILHVAEPRTLPRKVFMERKRRLYLSQNIEEILAQYGISDDDLLPPTISKSEDQFSLYGSSSFLPLESFDDVGFDPCSVEDWLELGKINDVQHPIPAVAFVPVTSSKLADFHIGKSSMRFTTKESRKRVNLAKAKKLQKSNIDTHYLWMDVAVTNYNYEINEWEILTLDGNQTKMLLPRIYVMFRAEDPLNFTYRVMDAVLRRRHTEKHIKFNIYCDCMPLMGLMDIDDDTMQRISKSVTRNNIIKGNEEILSLLVSDVQSAHKRNLAIMSFIHIVKKYPDMFSFIEIPSTEPMKVPEKCLIDTGMEDFQNIKNILKCWWLYVIDETHLGMMHVVNACLKINSMNFFAANYGKYVSLEEFDNLQTNCTINLIKFLQKEWVNMVVTNVRMCLQDIGKGWFNIKEKSWPIYEISKLCRFMELVKFRMQTALKYLVENSTDYLLKLIEGPCQICFDVKDDFVWGSDLTQSKFKPPGVPIFTLTLELSNDQPFYNTNPDTFEDVLIKLYDNAILLSHTVHQIHPYLLLNLRFPELFLSSLGTLDPLLVGKRDRIRTYINKSLIPLKAYAKEYQKYIQLFKLDINEYLT